MSTAAPAPLPPLNLTATTKQSNELAQTFTTGGINIQFPAKTSTAVATGGLSLGTYGLAGVLIVVALYIWKKG